MHFPPSDVTWAPSVLPPSCLHGRCRGPGRTCCPREEKPGAPGGSCGAGGPSDTLRSAAGPERRGAGCGRPATATRRTPRSVDPCDWLFPGTDFVACEILVPPKLTI